MHVFRHDVDLPHLVFVVDLKRPEVGVLETAPILDQADGHGRAEYGQTLVESDDLLLVQPQQGAVQELVRVLDPVRQLQVGSDGIQQVAERGLSQQIRAPAAQWQLAQQVVEQAVGCVAAQLRGFRQQLPVALQRHLHGLGIDPI